MPKQQAKGAKGRPSVPRVETPALRALGEASRIHILAKEATKAASGVRDDLVEHAFGEGHIWAAMTEVQTGTDRHRYEMHRMLNRRHIDAATVTRPKQVTPKDLPPKITQKLDALTEFSKAAEKFVDTMKAIDERNAA